MNTSFSGNKMNVLGRRVSTTDGSGTVYHAYDGVRTEYLYDEEGRVAERTQVQPSPVTTLFEYDELGREVYSRVTNRVERLGYLPILTEYDILGRVTAKSDRLGNWTRTEYSPDGNVAKTTYPNGSTRVVSNLWGRAVSVTGTAVTPEFYTYGVTADGLRWTRTVTGETPDSPRFRTVYRDMLGRTVREETPAFGGGIVTKTQRFNEFSAPILSEKHIVTNCIDEIIERTFFTYNSYGIPEITCTDSDLNGQIDFDGIDQILKTELLFVFRSGEIWRELSSYIWPIINTNLSVRLMKNAEQLTGLTTGTAVKESENAVGMVSRAKWTVIRDQGMMAEEIQTPISIQPQITHFSYGNCVLTISPCAITNVYTYDGLNRQISRIDGRRNVYPTEYNDFGLVSYTKESVTSGIVYYYDAYGNQTNATDALGNTICWEYDLNNRIVKEYGAIYPVQYKYNIFGERVSMYTFRSDGSIGDETQWIYDTATGLMVHKLYADNIGTQYFYTPDGNLSMRLSANGVRTEYIRNNSGLVTERKYSDDTPAVRFRYNRRGLPVSITVDGSDEFLYSYSDEGLCTNEIQQGEEIVKSYNLYGQPTEVAFTNGYSIRYEYDIFGRVGRIYVCGEPVDYHYATWGNVVTGMTFGAMSKQISYDPNRDLVTSICYCATNGMLISENTCRYDLLGNVTNSVRRQGTSCRDERFVYNERSELVAGFLDRIGTYEYTYDGIGNRVSSFELTNSVRYESNMLNQYTKRYTGSSGEYEPFSYDADGRLTGMEHLTLNWDAESRLRHIVTYDNREFFYEYDFLGRRIKKCNGTETTRFIYDGYNVVREEKGDSEKVTYFWGLDVTGTLQGAGGVGGLLSVMRDNKMYFPLYDCFGNITGYTDENCALITTNSYAPFGELTARTTNVVYPSRYLFSTRYRDDETGFYYYVKRFYSPQIGRWLSRDPSGENGGKMLYSMVDNRVPMFIDSLGENPTMINLEVSNQMQKIKVTKMIVRCNYVCVDHNVVCTNPCSWATYIGPTYFNIRKSQDLKWYSDAWNKREEAQKLVGKIGDYSVGKLKDFFLSGIKKGIFGRDIITDIPFKSEVELLNHISTYMLAPSQKVESPKGSGVYYTEHIQNGPITSAWKKFLEKMNDVERIYGLMVPSCDNVSTVYDKYELEGEPFFEDIGGGK